MVLAHPALRKALAPAKDKGPTPVLQAAAAQQAVVLRLVPVVHPAVVLRVVGHRAVADAADRPVAAGRRPSWRANRRRG